MKIYKKDNYILIVDELDKQIEDFASNVMSTYVTQAFIDRVKASLDLYILTNY